MNWRTIEPPPPSFSDAVRYMFGAELPRIVLTDAHHPPKPKDGLSVRLLRDYDTEFARQLNVYEQHRRSTLAFRKDACDLAMRPLDWHPPTLSASDQALFRGGRVGDTVSIRPPTRYAEDIVANPFGRTQGTEPRITKDAAEDLARWFEK